MLVPPVVNGRPQELFPGGHFYIFQVARTPKRPKKTQNSLESQASEPAATPPFSGDAMFIVIYRESPIFLLLTKNIF